MFDQRRGGTARFARAVGIFAVQLALLAAAALAQQVAAGPQQAPATLIGTVRGVHGELLQGATATLTDANSGTKQTARSDTNGFLHFSVPAGQYTLAVSSPGFDSWDSGVIALAAGDYREVTGIVLKMSTAVDTIQVTGSERELATQQVHLEEKQRVLGVIPNFYVSYFPDAAPLSARQKFQLAWRGSIDPFAIVASGLQAGVEQAQDDFPGYGGGTEGYAKRFGAAYADQFIGTMIGGAVLPSLFHQDPRYYYKGKGSIASRTLYAISTVLICKGDNGHWEPNYSFVLGNFASGAISNLYYPASNQSSAALTLQNGLIDTGMGAVNALIEEFVLKHWTHGAAASAAGH